MKHSTGKVIITEFINIYNTDKTLIDDFADDPAGWGVWLVYLLESLEKQAAECGQPVGRYALALELLRRVAKERLQQHQ